MLQAMVTDERGRDVPVVRELRSLPGPMAVWRKRVMLPKRVRGSLVTTWITLGYGAVFWSVLVGMMGFAVLSVGMGFYDLAGLREDRWWGVFWLSAPAVVLIGVQAMWAWSGRRKAALMMAAHGACPSCRASLLGRAEDKEGVVQCGTCQAHWKLGTPEACPTCGYDMRGAADVDGVATCPECASRWPSASPHRKRHGAIVVHGAIEDDAGFEVPHSSDPKAYRKVAKTRSKSELERAGLKGWLQNIALVFVFLFLPAAVALSFAWLSDRYFSGSVARVLTMLFVYGGLIIMAITIPRIMRKTTTDICRRLAICPACDADMRGTPPRSDGLTPCPACDAKWKLPASP